MIVCCCMYCYDGLVVIIVEVDILDGINCC